MKTFTDVEKELEEGDKIKYYEDTEEFYIRKDFSLGDLGRALSDPPDALLMQLYAEWRDSDMCAMGATVHDMVEYYVTTTARINVEKRNDSG